MDLSPQQRFGGVSGIFEAISGIFGLLADPIPPGCSRGDGKGEEKPEQQSPGGVTPSPTSCRRRLEPLSVVLAIIGISELLPDLVACVEVEKERKSQSRKGKIP